ncbi:hypothetical protein GLOTRDRAFT_93347 [Gloeophyllum trabeum ATCC 11539]|uniref:Uncharacterized protein n=1 Tax=Gloeophyllum trabeum (strain ATCC 11539 / FP-39264 / Madison 617) TaxID=670483 RepID=S7RMU4_GLOTA|nr:uncharacterized protein GLOTRDRAFT_93347 [Gloeophyllum trabeum ATCC 11539]EPQ55790.1 hypothetical protein GLOTRDRAFT_93347 [Gloeophyllum trabeum ATCC 11539]
MPGGPWVRVQEIDASDMYRATMEQQLREEQEELLAVVCAEQEWMRCKQEAWNKQLADGQRRMHEMMNFIKAREEAEKAAAEQMQAALAEVEEQQQRELAEAEARKERELVELEYRAKRQTELAQLMSKIGGSIHMAALHPQGEPTVTMGSNQRPMSSADFFQGLLLDRPRTAKSLSQWQEEEERLADPTCSEYDQTGPQPPTTAALPAPEVDVSTLVETLKKQADEALEEALDEVLEQFGPGSLGTGYRPISRGTRRKRPNAANERKEEYTKLKERNPGLSDSVKALDIKTDSDIAMKPRADTTAVEAYNDASPNGPDRDNLCIDMGAAVKDSRWNQQLVKILVERAHILCDQRLARGYAMEPQYGRDGTAEDQDELHDCLQTKYSGTHKKARMHIWHHGKYKTRLSTIDQTITIKSERGEQDTPFWTYLRSTIVRYGEDCMSSDDTDEETDVFHVRKMPWQRDIERELKIVDDQRDADGIKDNRGSKPAPRSCAWRAKKGQKQLDCLHIHVCNVRVTVLKRAIKLQDNMTSGKNVATYGAGRISSEQLPFEVVDMRLYSQSTSRNSLICPVREVNPTYAVVDGIAWQKQ